VVRREAFLNKIKELNYTYKTTQKRTYLYRKIGGTHYISVPKSDLLEDEFVTSSLRQAGCSDPEIKSFIASAKS
jgi:hypothetical protein